MIQRRPGGCNTITLAGSGPRHLGTVDLFGYAGGGSLPIEVSLSGTIRNRTLWAKRSFQKVDHQS